MGRERGMRFESQLHAASMQGILRLVLPKAAQGVHSKTAHLLRGLGLSAWGYQQHTACGVFLAQQVNVELVIPADMQHAS